MKKRIEEITKEYQNKIRLIKKYNKLYYNEDNPSVSDEEYDNLKKEIISLEKKNKFLSKFD